MIRARSGTSESCPESSAGDANSLLCTTMQFPFRLASLIPFWHTSEEANPGPPKFNFTSGDDVFSPMDLVSMSKPGVGIANPAGDLLLLPIKTYNVIEVECAQINCCTGDASDALYRCCRDRHSFLLTSLGAADQQSHQFIVSDRDSVFWLDSRTIAHIVHIETEESPYEKYDLKALSLELKDSSDGDAGHLHVLDSSFIATLPTSGASDFRYLPQAQRLIFYDQISKDGYFTTYLPEEEATELEDSPPFFASMFNSLNDPDPDLYVAINLESP